MVRILLWHVHGSWTTSFVQGRHEYVVPVNDVRDEDGRGRARTWDWPDSVVEVPATALRDLDLDLVVLQRPHEPGLVRSWCGRVAGRDLPAVYLEHNTPTGDVPCVAHALAGQRDVPIVHVTHFNRLMWDNGLARTFVVEHGVVDPGYRYTGEVARAAVVTNDPVRRERFVGADLYRTLAKGASLDIFGMRVDQLAGAGLLPPGSRVFEDLPQRELHQELARRRVYLHTTRWTSLGLSLIEAMMMGMPVVGLGSTEIHRAVPAEAGAVSTDPRALNAALRRLVHEPELARKLGLRARAAATQRYNLPRFLDDWERVFASLPTPARSA